MTAVKYTRDGGNMQENGDSGNGEDTRDRSRASNEVKTDDRGEEILKELKKSADAIVDFRRSCEHVEKTIRDGAIEAVQAHLTELDGD